jgi:hypothetical protein
VDEIVIYETVLEREGGPVRVQLVIPASTLTQAQQGSSGQVFRGQLGYKVEKAV